MRLIYSITLAAIIVFAFSCRPAKKIQKAIVKKDTAQTVMIDNSHFDSVQYINNILNKVKNNRIDFKTFSAKVKVNFTDKEGEQPELTVFVKMQKDSIIWLNIQATILGVEVLRVMVTPDSVKVLNKREKYVQYRSVSYLQELTQLPFDFTTLQDFLIGNPIYLDSNVVSYKNTDQSVVLMDIGQLFKHLATISNNDYLIQHTKLDDVDPLRNRTGDITYSGYENRNGIKFATERRISVSEKSKLDIDMDFKQYGFNETLSYPFNIPKNYKRK